MAAVTFATTVLAALAQSPSSLCDGPPAGPSSWAYCPVTGKNVSSEGAVSVEFKNGQKLFVASAEAASAYKAAPQARREPRDMLD